MTLGFQTKFPNTMPPHMAGKPTYFPDKVLKSLCHFELDSNIAQFVKSAYYSRIPMSEFNSKKHTIREDAKGLWKPGRDIHFVINNRTKNRFQFAPVVKCVSVQKLHIYYTPVPEWSIFSTLEKCLNLNVKVDGKILKWNEVATLAINDGFDSINDFMCWFNKDFKGKIIHWTNTRY